MLQLTWDLSSDTRPMDKRMRVRFAIPAQGHATDSTMIRRWLFENGAWSEAIRFGLVGIKSNVVYYFLYVGLALAGASPNVSVTVVYCFGIAYTFWFNKGFVFKNPHAQGSQFAKYVFVYAVAWGLNVVLLDIAISRLGLIHYLAQALLILPIAGLTFVSLKLFVFPRAARPSRVS
jgi:putative flippase GtrA